LLTYDAYNKPGTIAFTVVGYRPANFWRYQARVLHAVTDKLQATHAAINTTQRLRKPVRTTKPM